MSNAGAAAEVVLHLLVLIVAGFANSKMRHKVPGSIIQGAMNEKPQSKFDSLRHSYQQLAAQCDGVERSAVVIALVSLAPQGLQRKGSLRGKWVRQTPRFVYVERIYVACKIKWLYNIHDQRTS